MEAYGSVGKERVSVLLSNLVQTKMSLAVGFASRASVYDAVLTAYELSTAQCIVLALLHGLVNNDVAICSLLGTLSSNIQHLRSSYLRLWLQEDFKFESKEIYRALSTAAHYINGGFISVPTHVLQILASVADMYKVVELCIEEGDKDTLNLLESLGVDIGKKSLPEDDSPAASAEFEEEIVESPEVEIAQEEPPSSGQAVISATADSNNGSNQPPPAQEEIYVAPFQDEHSDSGTDEDEDEDYIDEEDDYEDYEGSDFEELFTDESSEESDSSVATIPDRNSTEMSALTLIVSLAEAFSGPGLLEPTEQIGQVDNTGKTVLHRAAQEGSVRIIKALLRLGAEVECRDHWLRTPAHVAAAEGHLQALRALYHHGDADLMARDNRGDTMLHTAADRGHYQVVRWLLRHGMDVEVSGRGGWRPMHRAAQQGQLETVRLLLDSGGCPNMMADVGGTALHRAAWWDKLEVAHLLIARGANVDAVDNRGDTPLHMAAKLGHLEMVRLLLDCGADPALVDRISMTPHDWAERNRRTDVAEYMMSRGAAY